MGAGTILREALAAAELLQEEFGIAADVYSVTSFTELRRRASERATADPNTALQPAWIEQQLPVNGAPVIAASDYVAAVPDLIRPWVRRSLRHARHRRFWAFGHACGTT